MCPVMACWTSIPEWSLGRSAHACSITCSGVAVGGHSRCRRPCRPVAVSRHNPTTRNGFLPHREALVVPVCNPNRACPTHPRNGPAVRRLPFFDFFFFIFCRANFFEKLYPNLFIIQFPRSFLTIHQYNAFFFIVHEHFVYGHIFAKKFDRDSLLFFNIILVAYFHVITITIIFIYVI